MLQWDEDLRIRGSDLFLDSRKPREICAVSHAHSDHLGAHVAAFCTPETSALAEMRIGIATTHAVPFGQWKPVDRETSIRFSSAGHVLGSAMMEIRRPEGTLLYTGDFKLRSCLTVPRADPPRADVLVMESTYGKPMFRFPPRERVIAELIERIQQAMAAGRQPIVMGYSLGKAQEIVRILTDAGLRVTCHGAVANLNGIYEKMGVALGAWQRYDAADFHGPRAMDLFERGVIVAPPQVARSSFVARFTEPLCIMMSGWGMLKGAEFRYGVNHVLPLSDHADYDELLELIERVQPKKIFTHHGFKEFADDLQKRGFDATTARKDRQLSLFE